MFKIIDVSFTYFSSVSIFNFEQVNAGWELSTHLRMHRENALSNKTQNLTKSMNMGISLAGTQNQLFIRGSYSQNTVISGKTLFNSFQHVALLYLIIMSTLLVIVPFWASILIVLTLAFGKAVFYGNVALSIVVISTKKWYFRFFKKVFLFQKTCFKVKARFKTLIP